MPYNEDTPLPVRCWVCEEEKRAKVFAAPNWSSLLSHLDAQHKIMSSSLPDDCVVKIKEKLERPSRVAAAKEKTQQRKAPQERKEAGAPRSLVEAALQSAADPRAGAGPAAAGGPAPARAPPPSDAYWAPMWILCDGRGEPLQPVQWAPRDPAAKDPTIAAWNRAGRPSSAPVGQVVRADPDDWTAGLPVLAFNPSYDGLADEFTTPSAAGHRAKQWPWPKNPAPNRAVPAGWKNFIRGYLGGSESAQKDAAVWTPRIINMLTKNGEVATPHDAEDDNGDDDGGGGGGDSDGDGDGDDDDDARRGPRVLGGHVDGAGGRREAVRALVRAPRHVGGARLQAQGDGGLGGARRLALLHGRR